ncbi:hypothetical protein PVAND_003855 [Polypedilum vanderplanki]|uniref:Pre-mRNA cleavage complex 2 protein Pcf11 n=1 Tax=Polypedilum vanderplanki TaxID=319348 RepID=A0A9J6BVC0_POLVA|nr:hypothetical protein PVAND_003855 [Polypedilum vanderplanki]
MDSVKEKEIEEEYLSSLMDLNVNSKPLINMLTMLAEDNLENAAIIVRAIEKHILQVSPEIKLPILYLIDSIVKNVGDKYKQLFAQNIVNIFCGVFEKVNEKVREKMFNLRQTWNDVFPQTKLYALDVKVNVMDNNWPITAKVLPKSVHVNPNFLKKTKNPENQAKEDLMLQMQAKERELLELKQRKIELELMVTKKKIAEQEKEIKGIVPSTSNTVNSAISIAPVSHPMTMTTSSMMIPHQQGRIRIAPVSSTMLSSARPRDPRLSKLRPQIEVPQPSLPPTSILPGIMKLPRIPKYSNGNKSSSSTTTSSFRDIDERDSRRRREKDHDDSSSKEKSSKSSSSRKSSKSDSPRKKSDDDKKLSSKNSSSHHHKSTSSSSSHSRSRSSTKSPLKSEVKLKVDEVESLFQSTDMDMRPDSTTAAASSKISKNQLLDELLHDEDMKSNQEMMITTSNNEESNTIQVNGKCDIEAKTEEVGKKRSIGGEQSESESTEPSKKKNKTDNDPLSLFGNEDVDLRSVPQQLEKRSKSKEKADFETVRAKLNASKMKSKTTGVKLLEEIQPAPINENGPPSELVRKILQKKKNDVKELEEKASSPPITTDRIVNDIVMTEKKDEIVDYGSMTAAELRNTSGVPASLRKEKRKETKWSQPTMPWGIAAPVLSTRLMNNPNIPLPHHFINPWENNPMIVAMQKQSQVPLVLPQSQSQPILNNKMRTLRLDGTRDHLLRFYGEIAIIFNESGEAHDIRFSSGQSKVVIDDVYSQVLDFNDSYKPIIIDGIMHKIKFGSPTRELYIDENFYECYFNNQITQIVLGDKVRRVRIEGKAPEVKIGNKRKDVVLGLINMMIDAEIMVPVFLDTTVQYFEYKGQIFTLQFADFFLSVIINNEPFKVEFGGLPKNFVLNGQKHFIRFTVLPDDIVPGQVNLHGMKRTHLFRNCKSPPLPIQSDPMIRDREINQFVDNDAINKHLPIHHNPPVTTVIEPPPLQQQQPQSNITLPDLNISELLQQLVATGIIGSNTNAPSASTVSKEVEQAPIKPIEPQINPSKSSEPKLKIISVNLSRPESIKMRQQAIIDTLYLGIQCSSCGLRFPVEQTIKYSQHLDWHFRQNRRERDSKRKAHSRKWYYNRSDWIKYEEIEDLDEREKNFFETQQMEAMDQGEDSNGLTRMTGQETYSCPAGPDDVNRCCEMCNDQFDQFFNEETEEWHLRSAIKVDNKFFHPICYEDYKASFTLDESGLNEAANDSQTEANDSEVKVEDANAVKDEKSVIKNETEIVNTNTEDDDDVIVLPPEEPVITEIIDEQDHEMTEQNESPQMQSTIIDDDIMIQEPKIETQIVNDDDDSNDAQCTSEDTNTLPFIVKIKEEPKDDGYEDQTEEDPFIEVTSINEELMLDDGHTHSPFQPALDENAVFDESSLFSQNSNHESSVINDDSSRHEPSSEPLMVGGNKNIKIVLSSLVQNNLSNKGTGSNNFVNNDQNDNSNIDTNNKLIDSNSNDLQRRISDDRSTRNEDLQENTELPYIVKESLQGFNFEKTVTVKRGIENSGLCSIM